MRSKPTHGDLVALLTWAAHNAATALNEYHNDRNPMRADALIERLSEMSNRLLPKTCPSWRMMCKIKELFWEPNDVVIQYHPAKNDYVNMHEGCLHLWQPFENGAAKPFPTPPSIMVGYK